MNNKILLGVLLGLLLIYGISRVFSGSKEKSFKAELIQIDTTSIAKIEITPKGDQNTFSLTNDNGQWMASKGTINVVAIPEAVAGLIDQLALVKTKHIAAKSADKWAEYELEPEQAGKLSIYTTDGGSESFYIGKFSFNQQARTATSYLRLEEGDEVYAVDGFQGMAFSRTFNDFRNKVLARTTPDVEFTRFQLDDGRQVFNVVKIPTAWTIDGTQPLDSMKVENYLNTFRNFNGVNFIDNIDPSAIAQLPKQSLRLEGNNLIAPINITVYQDASRPMPFIIHSTANPDAYFASDSTGIYSQIVQDVLAWQ
jgi:hypothetical protein